MIRVAEILVLQYAVLSYLVFALSFAGAVTAWTLIGATAIAGGSGILFARLIRRGDGSPIDSSACRAILLSSGAVTLVFTHVLRIPPYQRDDLIYHLMVPKTIAAGGIPADPLNLNANFPMLFEMPLVAFQSPFLSSISPYVVNLCVLFLLGIVFGSIVNRWWGVRGALLSLSIVALLSTPLMYDLVQSAYVDLFFTLVLLLGIRRYARHLGPEGESADWYLGAAFFGLLAAMKYHGALYLALFAVFGFLQIRKRPVFYVGLLVGILCAAPWYLKNLLIHANPVFPLLANFFPVSYLSSTRAYLFRHIAWSYNAGGEFFDYVLLPFRLFLGIDPPKTSGAMGFGGKLSLFFVLSLLGLGLRNRAQRVVTVFWVAGTFTWIAGAQLARYILPVFTVTSLWGMMRLKNRSTLGRGMIHGLLIVTAGLNTFHIISSARESGVAEVVSGKVAPEAFLRKRLPLSYGVAQDLRQLGLSNKDTVLTMGNYGRNYYFPVAAVTNLCWDTEYLDRAFRAGAHNNTVFTDFLSAYGISHVLFNDRYYRQSHARNPHVDQHAARAYLLGTYETVLRRDGIYLLSVDERGSD